MKKPYKIIVLLLLVLLLSPVALANAAFASSAVSSGVEKKEDTFLGSFSPTEIIASPNQPFSVSFTVTPIIDTPDTTIKIILPADLVALKEGDLTWKGDLAKDQKQTITLTLALQGEFEAYVKANVKASVPQGKDYKNSYYLHITLPEPSQAQHKIKPVKSADLPATLSPIDPRDQKSVSAPSAPGSGQIEIQGSWWYVNDEGGWNPGRYMLVELWDDDTVSDEHVASQWTGANGEFEMPHAGRTVG